MSERNEGKRLTKWNGTKWILPQGRTSEGESYWRIIAERLAEFENIGLEPSEIREFLIKLDDPAKSELVNLLVKRDKEKNK